MRPAVLVYFSGLFGPNGPLPLHLTQLALDRQRQGDFTLTNFANIFHHRFLCFFYRAWSCTRVAPDLDRPGHQRFATFIASFFGGGSESLQNRAVEFQLDYRHKREGELGGARQSPRATMSNGHGRAPWVAAPDGEWHKRTADWPKLFFAGRFSCQTRNAEGLRAIIQDYFQLPTEVLSFFGRWIALPPEALCRLGTSPQASELGLSLIAGESIWDRQMSVRLRLGPMLLGEFQRLLPGGASFERLKRWVFEYIGAELRWDAQLVLRRDQVPETKLGRNGQLGWTTFLKSAPFEEDADALVLIPEEQ